MIKSILPVLFFFFIVLTTSLVAADKVVTTSIGSSLVINTWELHTIPQNQPYTIVWDVSDNTGVLLNNTDMNCIVFMNKAGSATVLISGNGSRPPGDTKSWYKTIAGGNFSQLGHYNIQLDCNKLSNTSISGNALYSFDVTADGNSLENNNTDNKTKFSFLVFFFTLAGILIIFGIMKGDSNMSMFGTFVLFLLSLYTLINGFGIYDNAYTNMFSLILVGLSVYIAAKCMEDWLSNLNRL